MTWKKHNSGILYDSPCCLLKHLVGAVHPKVLCIVSDLVLIATHESGVLFLFHENKKFELALNICIQVTLLKIF